MHNAPHEAALTPRMGGGGEQRKGERRGLTHGSYNVQYGTEIIKISDETLDAHQNSNILRCFHISFIFVCKISAKLV